VRRLRAEHPVLEDVAGAIGLETSRQCAADPTQHEVLVTRSVGAMRKLREQYLAHREALDRAIVALDREIHQRETAPVLARAQLGLLMPA
jgi:hypothetical protein